MNDDQLERLVSVIIPTYNSAKYLPHTIQSVLNQTYAPVEIIVVNDGSKDNTKEVIQPYQDQILYFHRKNAGVSRARNFGISQAHGRYIAFLDSDDLWHRDKLIKQVDILEKYPECGLVCTDYAVFRNDHILSPSEKINRNFPNVYNLINLLQQNFIMCSSVVVSRKAINTVGVFDESLPYSEDYDLWLRIATQFKIHLIDEVLAQYRIVDKSFTRRTNEEQRRFWHFKVMERVIEAANGQISKSKAKEVIAETYFRYGYIDFIHQQFKNARKYLYKSMSVKPVHPWKSLGYITLSFFPFITQSLRRKNLETTI